MTETQRPPFDSSLNEPRTEATIEIEGAKFVVTAGQLEIAIRELARLRAQMTPDASQEIVPDHLLHIGPYRLIHQPGSYGKKPTESGAFLLGLSPGIGWLQLYLSPDSCRDLSTWINTPRENFPTHTLN